MQEANHLPIQGTKPLDTHVIQDHRKGARTAEEVKVVEAVQTPLEQLSETKFYDFTGNAFVSFLRKVARFLDFTKYLGGMLNSNTIVRGALKDWDPERIKTGKHTLLKFFGAEHLQFKSTTHETVDAHYLSSANLIKSLEEVGGKKKSLKLELPENSPFNKMKRCYLHVEGKFEQKENEPSENELPIVMHELNFDEEQMANLKESTFGLFDKKIIKDSATGKFYLVDLVSYDRLLKSTYSYHKDANYKEHLIFSFNDLNISESGRIDENVLGIVDEFPAIVFNIKDWNALSEEKRHLLQTTSWSIVYSKDQVFLVRKKNIPALEMFFENEIKDSEMKLKIGVPKKTTESQKTILLTQNQTDVYEGHIPEILSYALEGINVMVYNNPGKGLSTGLADNSNINASIESAYKYLREIKHLKNNEILAKGECFGAAPTAWLGKKHPQINLMMDQNLANFHEIVMQSINDFCEKALQDNKPNEQEAEKNTLEYELRNFKSWAPYIVKLNFIIEGLVKALFSGYNTAEDLRHNRGHQLININVPYRGEGGDDLVPSHHPELMIDSLLTKKRSQVIKLSMNPGGTHVTNWWKGRESREAVMDFFKAIDFLPETKEENIAYEETLSTVPYKKRLKREKVKETEPPTFWERFLNEINKEPPDLY